MRATRALCFAALVTLASGRTALAQLPEGPYVSADGRIAVAGELSATVSRSDDDAFFNYTDYEHDALRTGRVRLLGEWRATPRLSLLGELRIENRDTFEAAALYVRFRPWLDRNIDIQAGRIPPVIGRFARQAYGRDNLVIGVPLVYQYLTSLRPDALPAQPDDVLRMRARGWRASFPLGAPNPAPGLPLLTASHWDTGAEAHWQAGRVELAGALTRGAPASPAEFDIHANPTWSGRAAVTTLPGLSLGVSAARGRWVGHDMIASLPEHARARSHQTLVGADAEYGLGPLLVRGEWLRSRFDVPTLANPLVASGGFVEGRYRWHPRWQAALRVEHLGFSDIQGTLLGGAATPWDAPLSRVEAVLGFRATRSLEIRGGWQHNQRAAGRVVERDFPTLQVLYWF